MKESYSGIREQRPQTYYDLGGSSRIIAGNFEKQCIASAERSFAQGRMCTAINGMAALMSLQDAAFIMHSPQGCTGCNVVAEDFYKVGQIHRGIKNVKSPHLLVTNLDGKDVVFGGEKKLVQAIHRVEERYHPKVIFLFTSCASAMIGDDVDSVVESEQKSVKALLVPVHCEGFRSRINASGFDFAFIAISKYILKDKKLPRQENLINLFAPTTVSYKDQLEIKRILGLLGLEVNYIPFFSTLEGIQKIPSAAASTSICKVFADQFMIELEEKYGIPYSHTVMPVGVRNTDIWLRGIAKVMHKEAEVEKLIESEHKRILPIIAEIKERLKGKRVFVAGGTGRSFAAAALVDDFGMALAGVETPAYDRDAQDDVEYLNSIHQSFVINIAQGHPFELLNILKKVKPDVFIGAPEWAGRLGIPTTHILDPKRPTMGYDGLLYLGHKIIEQIENPSYNKKIAAHAHLPYRDSWWKEDPFKYIIYNEGEENVGNN